MNDLWLTFAISVAGGIGAAGRYLVDSSVPVRIRERFPWGIMIVNLSGSFLLGLLVGATSSDTLLGVCGIGLLGGYTTFSTASYDTVRLLRERRTLAALLNGPGMLLAGVSLAVLGIFIASLMGRP